MEVYVAHEQVRLLRNSASQSNSTSEMHTRYSYRLMTRTIHVITVGAVCETGSMKLSGVRPSVRPSVCPFQPPHAAAAGLLLWVRRAAANAGTVTLLADVGS